MFTDAQTVKRAMENKVNSEDLLCFMLKRSKTNTIVEFTVKTEAVLFYLSQRSCEGFRCEGYNVFDPSVSRSFFIIFL